MGKYVRGSVFLGAASLLTSLAPQMAMAQSASVDSARAEDGRSAQDQEIIVTAQKRGESIQRVPAAVTALTGEALLRSGVADLTSAQNYVPSVRFQIQSSVVEIYLRGIGSTNDAANTEPPNAFNFNGFYLPREGASAPIYDIERIEVLPGPQGTLYGRSALGGAVNVLTQRPTNELETKGVLEAGNYDLVHVTAIQNLPISDKVAVRGAIDYTNHDGYFKTGAASADTVSGRLSLLVKPTENVTAFLFGQHTSRRGKGANLVNKGLNPNTFQIDGKSFLHDNAWDDTMTGPLAGFTAFSGPITAVPNKYDATIVGAQLDWTLGDVTVTDVASYFDSKMDQEYWLSAIYGINDNAIKQYTNELRVSGDTDTLKWLAGVNVYRMVNSQLAAAQLSPTPPTIPLFANDIQRNRSQGIGIFAHFTYSLTDALRVVVGGRYSSDSRKGRGLASDATGRATIPWTASVSSERFDWKLGVEYDVAPKAMVYAIAQSGYQPATYNAFPNSATFNNRVDAPTITAYTAGLKSKLFDNVLQFNTEAFYYIYKGLPLQAFNLALQFNAIFNAERVEIYGNQTDIVFSPTQSDRFNLTVGYLHARQTKAVTPAGADFSGLQLQNAPDWTLNAGYSHDFRMSSGYIRAAVDTHYESSFFGDYAHSIGTRQKPYFMSNASLTYNSDQNWSIGAWIKNIENEPVQAAVAANGLPGPAVAFLQAPRTYGVRATFAF